jgi:hypothetical protein
MYYNYHWPLTLVNLLNDLIGAQQSSPNTPAPPLLPVVRVWFSQPRPSTDPSGEILTVNFKLPVSIGEFSIEILRVSCTMQVWYQDRSNNWIQMPDENYQPVQITLSSSQSVGWYTWHVYTYPIVAKAIQFRIVRRADPTLGNRPYNIGLRNGLLRRNIYNRSAGTQTMESEQDVLGDTITKYIQDWDASQAIDDNPNTFWRSAPQPDPSAVASLYLNFLNPDNTGQLVDALYIDPVYTGQNLNVYYSNDDTVGTLTLSPVGLPPDTDENTAWKAGVGRSDISALTGTSIYQFPVAWGPLVKQDCWVGVQWAPDFSPAASNAVQQITINGNVTGGTLLLYFEGHPTPPISYTPSTNANVIQTALAAVPEIGTGNVAVTGPAGGPYIVVFQGALGGVAIPTMTYDDTDLTGTSIVVIIQTNTVGGVSSLPPQNPVLFQVSPGMNAVQTITINGTATGGSFQLSLDGVNYTTAIPWSATGSNIQTDLAALAAIGTGNVLVVGDAGGPWSVTFQGALAQQNVATMVATSALTGGTPAPSVKVITTTTGSPPPNPGSAQYWPRLYYDVGAGEIVLELTNGTTAQTYSAALSPIFVKNAPLAIVAGWRYNPSTVFISVVRADGTQIGTTTATPSNLPTQITLDGEVGYQDFRGIMTATVVKLENWTAGQSAFQANPTMYVNPNPTQPNPNTGVVPSTTLDNAIFAVDWTLQDMGCGGGHSSFYTSKMWTPIFANYIAQKGWLYFPQPVMLKFLQLEFSNLTEESYPVYDSGVQVMYLTFPLSVTLASPTPSSLATVAGLLSVDGQALGGGIGSVNWLNSSSINAAVRSVFGTTVPPLTVQTGPGTVSTSLPNTVGSTASGTSVEQGTAWVYRRALPNTQVLASQQLNAITSNTGSQGVVPATNSSIPNISGSMTPLITFSPGSTSLPLQGADWWIVPGQTLALPATVMNGLTQNTRVALNRKASSAYRMRFTATCIHQYETATAVRDAAIAYYAGVREISAFITNYIATQDPPVFSFSPYDPHQWTFVNVRQLDTGPISTAGITYQIQNPLFDTDLSNWTPVHGIWSLDPAQGKWQYGAATVTADGTEKELLSEEMTAWPQVTAGAHFSVSVWVQWFDATSTGQPVILAANYYTDSGATYVSQQTASMAATGTNLWATGGEGGAQLTGSFTVPSGVDTILISLIVGATATAGKFWFDTVLPASTDTVEATTYIDLITTSTFVKVDCSFSDSGLVRSDDMWAEVDLTNTNISATQLAWYTTTIPSTIPSGTWGDTIAKWTDPVITWGEPFSEVAITIDPNMVYNGKRVLHFTRAAGAEEAGIQVRQVTNFVRNGLFRLCITYLKLTASANQIVLRLRRVSDGVYIYEEAITPQVGTWWTYKTHFQEIPDSPDQIYTLEAVLQGDAADDIYLNDTWTEIANIRYFARLGGSGAFLHDVTELAYNDTAIVSTTVPVNELVVQSTILSPTAWAYGARLTPNYLR